MTFGPINRTLMGLRGWICQCSHHPSRTEHSGFCFSQCNQSDIVAPPSVFLFHQCYSTGCRASSPTSHVVHVQIGEATLLHPEFLKQLSKLLSSMTFFNILRLILNISFSAYQGTGEKCRALMCSHKQNLLVGSLSHVTILISCDSHALRRPTDAVMNWKSALLQDPK